MANTSAQVLTDSFSEILSYAGGTGSVNFYMAHGGTNFGWTAGELGTCGVGMGRRWGQGLGSGVGVCGGVRAWNSMCAECSAAVGWEWGGVRGRRGGDGAWV